MSDKNETTLQTCSQTFKIKFLLFQNLESCTGPNQVYKEFIDMNDRDVSCRTYGYHVEADSSKRWAPHCHCKTLDFRKLSDGTCVHISNPQCVAEYQPSEGIPFNTCA